MRFLQSAVFRAVVAVAVGVLLVKYREDTMRWLTIVVGLLFIVSGLVSSLVYVYERKRMEKAGPLYDSEGREVRRRAPLFPFVGVGSVLLGVILSVMPTDFIIGVTYVLAAVLILGAVHQFVTLALARRFWRVPLLYWLFPLVTLGVGILVVAHPMDTATLPLKVIGWCLMFYGVVEFVNALQIHRMRRKNLPPVSSAEGEPVAVLPAEPVADGTDEAASEPAEVL